MKTRILANLCEKYLNSQKFVHIVGESLLPTLTLDISDNNVPRAVEQIVDWMKPSGGLFMADV